jgi:antibiotic biosynthesis monooxygenase (ABM) superfamily enzyme
MKFIEFVSWWLGQGENALALVIYLIVFGLATVVAFLNSWMIGVLFLVVLGSPPFALLIYVANKEIRKTYKFWLDKQPKK